MAKLSSYYTLCPLIDQQSLLGVEKDSDPGCAIVTLGKNIVIRYKLQDLKQVSSWSSKERLTTQVIYDQTSGKYAAVFNENHIRVWSEGESDLDKVKKHRFDCPFHTVLTLDGHPPVLVRQNCATGSLAWSLENRKSWSSQGVLKKREKIEDCRLINANGKTYLCALTKIGHVHNYIVVPLKDQTYEEDAENLIRIELKRTSEQLVGHVVTQDRNTAYLLTLWSHGRLYSFPLTGPSANPAPGTLLDVVTDLSTNHPVVMVPLNEITIAMYGADALEEGAVLTIYNVQFKLVQATQKLKLYTKEAKLWKIDDKLLLAANQHLAVAPYRLAPQRIEAVVGSSKHREAIDNVKENDNEVMVVQEMVVANWGEPVEQPVTFMKGAPENVEKQISVLLNEGLPEAAILEALIPQLIQSKDICTLIWCLNSFKDVPEKLLMNLLSFCLTTPDATFESVQNGASDSVEIIRPVGRVIFLDKILCVGYSDICLLSHLKTALGFKEILTLLNYLIHKLGEESEVIQSRSEPSEEQILDWVTLLLDSHYQQYLLSQDPVVLELLKRLSCTLEEHFQLIDDLQNLRPLLERVVTGKPLIPTPKDSNKFYSIEEVKLY